MSSPLKRLALLLTATLLLAACGLLEPEEPVVRALAIDRQSLPSHRQGDTIEQLERHFLARQKPGDRLIAAGLIGSGSMADDGSPIIRLDDRPLRATRSLRQLNRRMAEGRDGEEHDVLSTLVTVAETLSDANHEACLYFAFDPDRIAAPEPDTTFSRRRGIAGNGWQTFILIPENANIAHPRVTEWIHNIHHLGATRIQVRRLNETLPEC